MAVDPETLPGWRDEDGVWHVRSNDGADDITQQLAAANQRIGELERMWEVAAENAVLREALEAIRDYDSTGAESMGDIVQGMESLARAALTDPQPAVARMLRAVEELREKDEAGRRLVALLGTDLGVWDVEQVLKSVPQEWKARPTAPKWRRSDGG